MITRSLTIISLFVLGLTSAGYGVSVGGLKLDRLKEKLELSYTDSKAFECEYLDDLFQNVTFQETTNEEISVQLLEESLDSTLVNSDDESSVQLNEESKINKIKSVDAKLEKLIVVKHKVSSNKALNRSRYPGKAANKEAYRSSNNYLCRWPPVSETDKPVSQLSANVSKLNTQKLCYQLTKDAFLISESGVSDRPGATTCLCVALRDKEGYVKKFVFYNGENLLPESMRNKADELGYDVIQVEQSHAEGQLIQFLLYRHQKNSGLYTHIMGMGCSRSHCIECHALLKLYLGKGYHQFTASINTKNAPRVSGEVDPPDTIKTCIPEVNVTTRDTGELVVNKLIERTGTVVYGQDAIDQSRFEKFYLPIVVQDSIQEKLDKSISFNSERVTKPATKKVEKEIREGLNQRVDLLLE